MVLWALVSFPSTGHTTIGLKRTEDSGPTKDILSPDKLDNLGQIKIQVYRAKVEQKLTPYFDDGVLPMALDTVPEKLMKGRLVKNNTKSVHTEPHWMLD